MCRGGLLNWPWHGRGCNNLHYATISLSGYGICALATLGGGAVALAAGLARSRLRCSFAFALSCFDCAIFVNSLLTFFSASTVSLPAGMLPLRAAASCWATATTWDSGEIVGFVMYWCLKNTLLLTLVACVFVMYTQKERWCSIDVPRLKPGSDLVSHDQRLSGLTCIWIAHPIGAKGLHM